MMWAASALLCHFLVVTQSSAQPAGPADAVVSVLAETLAEDIESKAAKTGEYDTKYTDLRRALVELAGGSDDWREHRQKAMEFVDGHKGLLHIQCHRDWVHSSKFSAQELKAAYTRLVVLMGDEHPHYPVALHYLAASCYRLASDPGTPAGDQKANLNMALYYERKAIKTKPTLWPAYANILAILEQSGKGADGRSAEDALKFLTATSPPWDRAVQRFVEEERKRRQFRELGENPAPAARSAHPQARTSSYGEKESILRIQSFFRAVRGCKPDGLLAPVPWRISLARNLKADGKVREAIDCCLSMLRADPGLGDAYKLLAELYRSENLDHLAAEMEYRMRLFRARSGRPARPR